MTIKELRKTKYEQAKDFAKAIGVSASRVSKWESGVSAPKLKDIDRIAEALGCSVEELMSCFKK